MIYIFDDKKKRQEGYQWTTEKFGRYADYVRPIYQYTEVQEEEERKKVFSNGNIILFHESFFDADFNSHHKQAIQIRKSLEAFAKENLNFYVAFFSGSKSGRLLDGNVAYLPVSIVYQNLEIFLNRARTATSDLKYLLYGGNPDQESILVEKLENANKRLEINRLLKIEEERNVLIARTTTDKRLPIIVDGAHYKMNLKDDTDKYFHDVTKQYLQELLYERIFIPLCFGPTLSDFNGLRLAAHIRCTDTINQCTPIYIYSFLRIDEIIHHECFNILKTRNVHLIDYKVSAFDAALSSNPDPFELSEIPREIAKIKLDVPNNYEDSHSIANEWAIYQWARTINADDTSIGRITEKVSAELYFKYLRAIYPASTITPINQDELRIDNPGQPKILYVDDDAEKGWFEILCKILSDINGIDSVDYLGDDLKKVTQKEIIDKAIRKIKEDDIDLVILDFRLHPDDFTATSIKNVTGLKLLKDIKKLNLGIQVIIFSATNKIWNIQALQDAGADGFIIKESPENSLDTTFTFKTLSGFIKALDVCIGRIFLKDLFKTLETIENSLSFVEDVPENKLFNKFLKILKKQFNVIHSGAKNIRLDRPITLDVVFLSCYTFLDLYKKYYLLKKDDHRYYLGFREEDLMRYNIVGNEVINAGIFIPKEHYDKPGVFHVYSGLLMNYYNNVNTYDLSGFIRNVYKIRDLRNEYIHGTKQKFRKEEITLIAESLLPLTHSISE